MYIYTHSYIRKGSGCRLCSDEWRLSEVGVLDCLQHSHLHRGTSLIRNSRCAPVQGYLAHKKQWLCWIAFSILTCTGVPRS